MNLFEKVQKVLKDRSKPIHIKDNGRIPKAFTRLLHCAECGMMITAEIQKGHTYYRCSKKSRIQNCKQSYIREEALNKQLSNLIQKVSLPQDWKYIFLINIKDEEKNLSQSCNAFVQMKKFEIEAINSKLTRLLDSYLDQVIDRNAYINKKAELMSQKKIAEEKIISFEQTQNKWLEPIRTWGI